ncbi:enolase C-terminal domain-like protein [Ramlibacter albus]|uniref:Mandelate racemase n=1 Tax=Ramlibacter albus TaxID=2079448 RepID=A0A923MEJ8_9BURK|nr:enolase C-terminal domain-like protein [Ramlibacter albus]MBC5768580.1 mandelate racemase [Ramlibacter albus]
MKITDVTLTLFEWDDIPATSYGSHTGRFSGRSSLGLLAIETDAGVTGHSFLGSAFFPAEADGASLIRVFKPMLVGQDPLDRERLNQAMWKRSRTTTVRTIGAVDVALWDIAGKVAGLPIHQLIGTCRHKVAAYISSAVLPDGKAYAEEALHYRSLNLAAYKIHPPQQWQDDIRVCETVRAAVGDSFRLMLDSTWAYDYPAALRVGRAIQDLGFFWYEDPLADNDIYNYVELRKHLHIPIMATEYPAGGLDTFAPWIRERATDYLRGDVAVKGGITTLLKVAHLAEAFHLNFEVHHGGNSLNNVANLHVLMAIANTELFEVLLPAESQKYGLQQDIEIDADGMVHAPTGPGLGAAIDFDLIRRKQVAVLS